MLQIFKNEYASGTVELFVVLLGRSCVQRHLPLASATVPGGSSGQGACISGNVCSVIGSRLSDPYLLYRVRNLHFEMYTDLDPWL